MCLALRAVGAAKEEYIVEHSFSLHTWVAVREPDIESSQCEKGCVIDSYQNLIESLIVQGGTDHSEGFLHEGYRTPGSQLLKEL